MSRREDPPSAAPVRVGISAYRKVFQVATMVGITAAASLSGCGGETTGSRVTTNASGATGGVQGAAGSTATGSTMNTGGTGGTQAACSQLSSGCTMDSDCCPPYLCITASGGSHVCEPDCVSLTEEACNSNTECQPIYGSDTGDVASFFVFEGCHAAVTGCPPAFMCAYPPGHPESCLLFNGCTPDGWTQDLSCSLAGCPHVTCALVGCPHFDDAGP
jgi:hypothetical protein